MGAVIGARGWRRLAYATLIAAVALVVDATAARRQSPPSKPKFKTGVEIVTITATVTDANGRLVTDLTKDDFEVFEDALPLPRRSTMRSTTSRRRCR